MGRSRRRKSPISTRNRFRQLNKWTRIIRRINFSTNGWPCGWKIRRKYAHFGRRALNPVVMSIRNQVSYGNGLANFHLANLRPLDTIKTVVFISYTKEFPKRRTSLVIWNAVRNFFIPVENFYRKWIFSSGKKLRKKRCLKISGAFSGGRNRTSKRLLDCLGIWTR